jgi:ABC-type transport system substrate-binding protein
MRALGRTAAAFLATLGLAFGAPASAESVLRVSMHSDLKIIDPIWTTALISADHGYLVYDTLFALDETLTIKPQMVDKWEVSPDKLTWTFTLRDGLEWHDGTRVTAADCVASIRRWGARDSMGQMLMSFGRQDDPAGAEGALRPGAAGARQDRRQRALHDAAARRRDQPQQPDQRRHRLGPLHLQA